MWSDDVSPQQARVIPITSSHPPVPPVRSKPFSQFACARTETGVGMPRCHGPDEAVRAGSEHAISVCRRRPARSRLTWSST
jgi:hypothetical protein